MGRGLLPRCVMFCCHMFIHSKANPPSSCTLPLSLASQPIPLHWSCCFACEKGQDFLIIKNLSWFCSTPSQATSTRWPQNWSPLGASDSHCWSGHCNLASISVLSFPAPANVNSDLLTAALNGKFSPYLICWACCHWNSSWLLGHHCVLASSYPSDDIFSYFFPLLLSTYWWLPCVWSGKLWLVEGVIQWMAIGTQFAAVMAWIFELTVFLAHRWVCPGMLCVLPAPASSWAQGLHRWRLPQLPHLLSSEAWRTCPQMSLS